MVWCQDYADATLKRLQMTRRQDGAIKRKLRPIVSVAHVLFVRDASRKTSVVEVALQPEGRGLVCEQKTKDSEPLIGSFICNQGTAFMELEGHSKIFMALSSGFPAMPKRLTKKGSASQWR
jgi:hypothetical protein